MSAATPTVSDKRRPPSFAPTECEAAKDPRELCVRELQSTPAKRSPLKSGHLLGQRNIWNAEIMKSRLMIAFSNFELYEEILRRDKG